MDPVDAAQALYWFAAEHHGGQSSKLYRVLSQVGQIYRPGARENGPSSEDAIEMYEMLADGAIDPEDLLATIEGSL